MIEYFRPLIPALVQHLVNKRMALIFAVALLGCVSCSRDSKACRSLAAIASDEKKMNYAKEWITSHLADPEFRKSLRISHSFDYSDERIQKFGGLDWKYLGFPERHAELVFNMPITAAVEWDITQVHSAWLDWGRSSIIIKLSSSKDLWPNASPEDVALIKAVGNDVFLYCDDWR
jgi:hypothetical protein